MDLTLTQNLSLTFSTSADVRLDFMFHVIEGSSLERTTDLLQKSWKESPLDTLKLLFYTRDIRRGKGCRAQFLLCLKWIYENQFETLLKVLKFFPEFGCYKDFFNLLLIALFDEIPYDCYETAEEKESAEIVSKFDRIILKRLDKATKRKLNETTSEIYSVSRKRLETIIKEDGTGANITTKISFDRKRLQMEAEKKEGKKLTISEIRALILEKPEEKGEIRRRRKEKKSCVQNPRDGFVRIKTDKKKLKLLTEFRKDFIQEKLKTDEKFAKLYTIIVDMLATQLKKDYEAMQKSENVSLLPKWIPNRGRQFDKHLQIQLPIARELLKRLPEFSSQQSDDKQSVFEFEKILAKLRRKIYIPEIDMSQGHWKEIIYGKVTSKAMLRYKASFVRNDFERFGKFITEAKNVKGGALTPGDIVREYSRTAETTYGVFSLPEMAEIPAGKQLELATLDKQWLSLVEDLKGKGVMLLENALAVCDVSGSMCCVSPTIPPIFGAVGLTLLLMHFTTGVWAKKCISFSEEPKIFNIDIEKCLLEQIRNLMSIDAGLSTNLNATFDLVLSIAKEAKLPQKQMPRVLFIFSDMEFNVACPGMTNFEVAQQQYKTAGYEMPLIVFWNLKGSKKEHSTPVQCNEQGVVLLSGYSAQTLSFFTCEDFESISPKAMLNKILGDERYAAFNSSHV